MSQKMTNDEYTQIITMLLKFYHMTDAQIWLATPHPQLKNWRPMDCTFDEVKTIIHGMESGAHQ